MLNDHYIFLTINILIVIILQIVNSNAIETIDADQNEQDTSDKKWKDQKFLLKYVSIVGAICVASIALVYGLLHYKRTFSINNHQNATNDKEKGVVQNALDELFKSTSHDDDNNADEKKRASLSTADDERAAKVHGFLMRAMTLPQSVIQTVGKIQTIQITEPSSQVEQNTVLKNVNSATSLDNCATSANSMNTTFGSKQQVERPSNFKNRPAAVKSPSSNYLKKSPSPTGQKSPPTPAQITPASQSHSSQCDLSDKQETSSAQLKSDEVASINRDSDGQSSCTDNQSSSRLELDDSVGEFKLGKLQFCSKYNYEKHAITVSMIKCLNLPGKSTMNAYVKLQLLPEKKHKVKTRTIRKNQNPCFQEDFTFFNIHPQQLENLALHFMIMSFDRYSRDEVLGEVLHTCNDQFDTLEKQVCLTLDICPKGLLSKAQGRGEILLSLCYHPSSALLSLVVLKAKNLQKVNITGLPVCVVVKINLYFNNKRIAKKKTHSKKRTLNPIYNEIFTFELSNYLSNSGCENEEYVDLDVWQNVKLELIVIDYDRITRNESIGCLTLNANDKHMKDMLNSPRKQIACWHKLSDV